MKAYSWKITGVAALPLPPAILLPFFRPPQQPSKSDSAAQAHAQQTRQDRPKPTAEELFQRALLHKESGDTQMKDLA
jgi:hypothetical protein